jgi:hypothetical protein
MGFKFVPKLDLKQLKKSLFNTTIYVGYSDTEEHYSGMTASELGKLMSYGGIGPEGNPIPARPHLEEGLEYGKEALRDAIRTFGASIFKPFGVKGGPEKIAEVARKSVIDYIRSGQLEPNAPFTVEKKGSNTPLIDQGALIHLLEAEIVKGGV